MNAEKQNRRGMYGGLVLGVAVLLLAVDQILKHYVLLYLKPVGSVTVVGGLLELAYVENTGAAFGLLKNAFWFLFTVTMIAFVILFFLLFRYKKHNFLSYASIALLIAGGIGNLIDRILYGYVVDFIHVLFFDYIFNFADCCITVGAVLLIAHVLLASYREKRQMSPNEALEDKEE